jgi:hypothetical protein
MRHPDSNVFAFIVGRPRDLASIDAVTLAQWTDEEVRREHQVARNGGRYYPPTLVERTNDQLTELRAKVHELAMRVDELEAQGSPEPGPQAVVAPATASLRSRVNQGYQRARRLIGRVPMARRARGKMRQLRSGH